MEKLTQELVADKFLWGLWRGIEDLYKDRYKRDVWRLFEDAIRSASYTSDLKMFLSNIQKKIPITVQKQHLDDVLSVVNRGEDEKILDWIRDETTYLVILVRLKNEERKESFKL